MFDPTKPVQTRDGRKATILCTDLDNPNYPIGARHSDSNGMETVNTFTANGNYRKNDRSSVDLVNIPERRYQAMFKSGNLGRRAASRMGCESGDVQAYLVFEGTKLIDVEYIND